MFIGSIDSPKLQPPASSSRPLLLGEDQLQPPTWIGEGYIVDMNTITENTPIVDWRASAKTWDGRRAVFFFQNHFVRDKLAKPPTERIFKALKEEFERYGCLLLDVNCLFSGQNNSRAIISMICMWICRLSCYWVVSPQGVPWRLLPPGVCVDRRLHRSAEGVRQIRGWQGSRADRDRGDCSAVRPLEPGGRPVRLQQAAEGPGRQPQICNAAVCCHSCRAGGAAPPWATSLLGSAQELLCSELRLWPQLFPDAAAAPCSHPRDLTASSQAGPRLCLQHALCSLPSVHPAVQVCS